MIHIQRAQHSRSFCELLVHCKVRAIISRIASAVHHFFTAVTCSSLKSYSQLREKTIEFLDPRKRFTNLLFKIPEDQRAAFVKHALSIINPEIVSRDLLIQTIVENDKNTLENNIISLVSFSEMFFSKNIQIMKRLADIPAEERDNIMTFATPLFTPRITPHERESIVQVVASVHPSEREDVIRNAELLIYYKMNASKIINIILALAAVPTNERALVTDLTFKINWERKRFYRTELINTAPIIKAIADIPNPEKREEVIENTLLLMVSGNNCMKCKEVTQIIQILAQAPESERDIITDLTLQSITPETPIRSKIAIIQNIAAIPSIDREEVMMHASLLFTPVTEDKLSIMRSLASLPANERELVTDLTLQVVASYTGPTFCWRGEIIKTIQAIPVFKREKAIKRALLHITPQMNTIERVKVIKKYS